MGVAGPIMFWVNPVVVACPKGVVGECATFDNFPDDLPLGGMKRPDLMLMGQVELSYGWRE